MSYKPKVLSVSDSGTGGSSFTAYAVVCGGTSSTSAFQSIAGVGSSGQVLTSNDASTLPTFQAASGSSGYMLNVRATAGDPNDNLTYFFAGNAPFNTFTTSGSASTRMYVPQNGTITAAYGRITVQSTLGSSQNCTLDIRLNNSSDTTVTSTLKLDTRDANWSNTGLSIAVTAGDYIEFKFTGASWSPNPTNCVFSGSVYIS